MSRTQAPSPKRKTVMTTNGVSTISSKPKRQITSKVYKKKLVPCDLKATFIENDETSVNQNNAKQRQQHSVGLQK